MSNPVHPLTQALIDAGKVFPIACCGRLSRPGRTPVAEAPGTIARKSLGECESCRKARLAADRRHSERSGRSGIEAYIASRRRRGVPPEGLRYQPRKQAA